MKRHWTKEPVRVDAGRDCFVVAHGSNGIRITVAEAWLADDAKRIVHALNALTGVGFPNGVKGGEVRELVEAVADGFFGPTVEQWKRIMLMLKKFELLEED